MAMRLFAAVGLLIASLLVAPPAWARCSAALTALECRTSSLVEQDRIVDAMLAAAREARARKRDDPTAALAARVRFADLLRLHGAAETAVALLEADAPAAAAAPIAVRQDFALALSLARGFAGDFDGAAETLSAGIALSDRPGPGLLRLKSFQARLEQVRGNEGVALAQHAALDADMRGVFGAASVDYARYLSDQAGMESAADHNLTAFEQAQRARLIFESQPTRASENYRYVLNNLVSYARYLDRDVEAAAINRRALPLYERALARRLADPTAAPEETQRVLRAAARGALAVLWRLSERTRPGTDEHTAILAEALATAAAVAETRTAVIFGAGNGGTAALAAARRRGDWAALLTQVARPGTAPMDAVARIASFLQRTRPASTAATPPALLDRTLLARVQRRLGPDEALLVVIPGTNDGFTIAVTREEAGWWITPLSVEAACQAVSKLRRSIVPGSVMSCRNARFQAVTTSVEQQQSFDPVATEKLYRDLVGGAAAMVSGKRRWHVLTYDSVASLPFGALVVSPPAAGIQPWHRIDWLARRRAVTLLPSLDALLGDGAAPRAGQGERRPVILAVAATCGTAPSQPDCPTGEVPAAAAGRRQLEMLVAAGRAGSRLLAGGEATRAAVLAGAPEADVLLFAVHARSSPTGTVLQLGASDGRHDLLAANDMIGVRLNDPVVMLAACDTSAITDRTQDDVLRDLAHAFITAGSRRLLLTHYGIAEGAAIYLMDRVVAELRAGDAPPLAEALRRATVALLDDPSARHLADPAAWSGFFAVGTAQ